MSRAKFEDYQGEQRKLDLVLQLDHGSDSLLFAAVIDAQEAKIRSDWVNTMEARLVREELAKCWRTEGVNHYQSCHALSEKYLEMVRTHRVSQRSPLSTCCTKPQAERLDLLLGHWIQKA